jgi:hypothetical protein
MLYAIQSDIVPIYADMPANPVLASFVRFIWVCASFCRIATDPSLSRLDLTLLTRALHYLLPAQLVPPIALLLFIVGLSFYVFYAGAPAGLGGTRLLSPGQYTSTGFALMFVGGGTLFLIAAVVVAAFIRLAGQYAEDWQQMMIYELQTTLGWKVNIKYDPKGKGTDAEKASGRADESVDSATGSKSSEDADDDGLKT